MARRNEQSPQQIKERVLQAAETLVKEEGLAALKVREIAMEIGYTVSSIYAVFNNMADLILQLNGRTLDDLAVQLAEIPPAPSPEQQLIALAQRYLQFACEDFNRWRMVFEHRPPHGEVLPDWYQEKIELILQKIIVIFQQLAPQISTEQQKQAAQTFWHSVHGICILSLTGEKNDAYHETENQLLLLTQSFIDGWRFFYAGKV
jgi:AcrR family transcriptional regulator